jgi:hypothetical protein
MQAMMSMVKFDVGAPKKSLYSRGCERQYCLGAFTFAPSFAAACQGQRGS